MKITKQQLKRIIREARFDDDIMRADTVEALWAQIDEVATTFSNSEDFIYDFGSMTEEQRRNVVELDRQIVEAFVRLEVLFEGLASELSSQ